jgi:hypothetical protein
MIGRVGRALVLALKLTAQGRRIEPKYPELEVWAGEAARQLEAVYRATNALGLGEQERKALVLHLDSRDISMETILASVRHHVTVEYVKLLLDSTPHSFLAIYASNLNDRYRLAKLLDTVQQPTIRAALKGLSEHLESIPSQPDVKNL